MALQLLLLGEAVWKGQKPAGLAAMRETFTQPAVIPPAGGTAGAFHAPSEDRAMVYQRMASLCPPQQQAGSRWTASLAAQREVHSHNQ